MKAWGLGTLSFVLFIFAVWLAYLGQAVVPCAFISAGVGVILIANLDRISTLEILKVKAIMKDARETLSELQDLAYELCSVSLWSLHARTYIGDTSEANEEFFDRYINLLERLKLPAKKIDNIKKEWERLVSYQYTTFILSLVNPPPAEIKEIDVFHKDRGEFLNINFVPASVEGLTEFFKKYDILDEDISEFLADYDYFLKNKSHRRIDVWKTKSKWRGRSFS